MRIRSAIAKSNLKISQRKYIETHRDKVREKYRRQGLKINRRVRQSLNCRISQMLKQHSLAKNNRTLQYVGCNFHFLKNWFEFQFQENMNWDNYGEYWEIDHIKPIDAFDLNEEEQLYEAFKYINTQPLKKEDNREKSNRYL